MVQGLFQSLFQVITWLLYIACFASGSEIQTKLNAAIAVRKDLTVRQEAVKIQAKRSIRGPDSVRKDLQRSDKKQSKYQLNAALAVRNRSGIGPKRFATVRQEAVKIEAKRSTRGPESVRKDFQRSGT